MKLNLLFFLALLTACEKSEVNSSIICEDKASGLEAVIAEIADYSCITNIYSGSYKEQPAYITMVVDPACTTDGAVGVYDCSGEFIGNLKSDPRLKMGKFIMNNHYLFSR